LQLINRAGERLLASEGARVIGKRLDEIGLAEAFSGSAPQTMDINFPGATGRWRIHRSHFREKGRPHSLLVLSDLSRPLREEELLAWQRLLRVLGHELNNSLAPIHSIAASLAGVIARQPLPADWQDDAQRGLAVISSRAQSLTRFTEAYVRLAKLPRPNPMPFDVESLLRHVLELERRIAVRLDAGPATRINADRDQLEQLLINVVRNAVDAALETGGAVAATWRRSAGELEIAVIDEGPGLSGTLNLFVPFYTTKPGGTGIGLVLCRQIADAHGGSFHLRQRGDRPGCEAVLRLPM
jgi:signal transduction histidine kinase